MDPIIVLFLLLITCDKKNICAKFQVSTLRGSVAQWSGEGEGEREREHENMPNAYTPAPSLREAARLRRAAGASRLRGGVQKCGLNLRN